MNFWFSAPVKISHRKALRETWLHSDPKMISYFVMGIPDSKSMQKRLLQENEKYNDIIQGK